MKIVTATRGKAKDTLLLKSLTSMGGNSSEPNAPEVFAAEDNSIGLPAIYNHFLSDGSVCFIHDDVIIADFWWRTIVEEGLKHFDVVGVAGNRRTFPGQRSWCLSEREGFNLDYPHLSGAIGQGTDILTCKKEYFGPCSPCMTLDGVFLAANGTKLKAAGVCFDEDFDFHFYDMSFCARVRAAGLTIGTIPLSLIHKSWGAFDQKWNAALELYRSKYG